MPTDDTSEVAFVECSSFLIPSIPCFRCKHFLDVQMDLLSLRNSRRGHLCVLFLPPWASAIPCREGFCFSFRVRHPLACKSLSLEADKEAPLQTSFPNLWCARDLGFTYGLSAVFDVVVRRIESALLSFFSSVSSRRVLFLPVSPGRP